MYPFGSLPENLIAFGAVLRRDHGFRIGPGELHDAARALEVVDLADERAVRHALRPILSGTPHDAIVFDKAFTAFMFPGPAGVRQDQMSPAPGEPASDAGGRGGAPRRGTPWESASPRCGRRGCCAGGARGADRSARDQRQ